jgi:hypothetical protein
MQLKTRSIFVYSAISTLIFWPFLIFPSSTQAASASMYISASPGVTVGDSVPININVNTNGLAANSFEATISYPPNLFNGVRGSFSGSICTLPVTQPNPTAGSATFACGTPGGFTGTGLVATIYLDAIASGSGNFGLSACTVLANDGLGTDITGSCSGSAITVNLKPTPPPSTPTPTPAPTPVPTPTPKLATPVPLQVKPNQTPKAAETPRGTPTPTPPLTPPPVVNLPATTATPTPVSAPSGGTSTSSNLASSSTTKRTISSAFQDLFNNIKTFKFSKTDLSGLVALLLTLIPFLALLFALALLIYRLYLLERHRKRTMDRLFEMELSELASLEGKMDLLSEKGSKGKEEYKQEFESSKERILRQLRPDYGKPVEPTVGEEDR